MPDLNIITVIHKTDRIDRRLILSRSWIVRKFNLLGFQNLIKRGKTLQPTDPYFPFISDNLSEYASICKLAGMIPIHKDRPQDQNYTGAFYPFEESQIWNFVLWVKGNPALLLGAQNSKVISLSPGMAIWFDITETFHGITQLCEAHPKEKPEAVICQVSGHPAFLYDAALREMKEQS